MEKRRGSDRSRRPATEALGIVRLWLLRILVPLDGLREFVGRDCFHSDVLAERLGLGAWIDPTGSEYEPRAVRAALRKLHLDGEQKLAQVELWRY